MQVVGTSSSMCESRIIVNYDARFAWRLQAGNEFFGSWLLNKRFDLIDLFASGGLAERDEFITFVYLIGPEVGNGRDDNNVGFVMLIA